MREFSWLALAASVLVGLLACALLVVNNLRDIGTDETVGKRTLAVMLGDRRSRLLYGACALLPFGAAVAIAPVRPLALLTLVAVPLVLAPVRLVASGASGRVLVAALGQTGRVQLAFGALLAIGLAIRLERRLRRPAARPGGPWRQCRPRPTRRRVDPPARGPAPAARPTPAPGVRRV